MSFSDALRKIYVDDRPLEVPENVLASEIIQRSGLNPHSRALVKAYNDGSTEILPAYRKPVLKDGDRFETQVIAEGG